MHAARPVTIHDIAAAAKVSVTTVSRVLNERPDVAAGTRERVRRAIDRLGFVPSAAARGLPVNQRPFIGVLTRERFGASTFFPRVLEGCALQAKIRGHSLLIVPHGDDVQDARIAIETLLSHRVAGIVVTHALETCTDDVAALLRRLPVPVVATGAFRDRAGKIAVVDVDVRTGARDLAHHLLAVGHRAIGVLRGPIGHAGADDRVAGHRDALGEAGIGWHDSLAVVAPWEFESGQRAVHELLSRRTDLDAIVCHHDLVAIGALAGLTSLGLRVPADIALVGFGDLPVSAYLPTSLTTMRLPVHEVGAAAIDRVLAPRGAPRVTLLPVDLVVRGSCGATRRVQASPRAEAIRAH